jgi:5'-nucleotidase
MKALILLSNDDGFYSEGIEALSRSLKDLGEVFIVAPDRERSASSLSLTLHRPLRVKMINRNTFAVDGTPADCVYLAFQKLLPRKPDILISGINTGPNLGQQDISYSGTVAAALQGTFLRVPSMAVSLLPDEKHRYSFDQPARIVRLFAGRLLENKLPEGVTLNINIPAPPIKGIKIAKLGQKRYNPEIVVKKDPRKRAYYWIGTGSPKPEGDSDCDVMVVREGYITVTPLHTNLTHFQMLQDPILKNIFTAVSDEIS